MDIQWYPGHMTKTKRLILENIKLVDIVLEVLDARIPYSSKNPDIDVFAKDKQRLIILNKSDLSDPESNRLWTEYYSAKGITTVLTDCSKGKGVNEIIAAAKNLMADKIRRQKEKGRINVPIRIMVAGIPNSGKSTLINRLVGKSKAKTGDKPGVTRGKQWINVAKDLDLLDTPGILWPKFSDIQVGISLAITGAINDQIIDLETLAMRFIEQLLLLKPEAIPQIYSIELTENMTSSEILTAIALKRGFLLKGGVADLNRTAIILLNEFRGGKLGRISLERPTEY